MSHSMEVCLFNGHYYLITQFVNPMPVDNDPDNPLDTTVRPWKTLKQVTNDGEGANQKKEAKKEIVYLNLF